MEILHDRGRTRFVDDAGVPWTIWDCTYSQFRHHRLPHESPAATLRVFVNAAGVKRSYTFKRGDVRTITVAELAR